MLIRPALMTVSSVGPLEEPVLFRKDLPSKNRDLTFQEQGVKDLITFKEQGPHYLKKTKQGPHYLPRTRTCFRILAVILVSDICL